MKRMLVAPSRSRRCAAVQRVWRFDATATTSSVVNLESSNYAHAAHHAQHHVAPVTTAPVPAAPCLARPTTDVTEYTVRRATCRSPWRTGSASRVDALNLANADTSGYGAFYVGLKIKIPAGAIPPGSTPTGQHHHRDAGRDHHHARRRRLQLRPGQLHHRRGRPARHGGEEVRRHGRPTRRRQRQHQRLHELRRRREDRHPGQHRHRLRLTLSRR